jgi:hypothetical protein
MSFDTTQPPLPVDAAQESGGNLDKIDQQTNDIAQRPVDDDGIPLVNPNAPGADIATGQLQQQIIALLSPISVSTQPGEVQPPIEGQIMSASNIVGPFSTNGCPRLVVAIFGTYAGVTITIEVSMDGVNWTALRSLRPTNLFVENAAYVLATNETRLNIFDVGGYNFARVRSTAWTSGTASIIAQLSVVSAPSLVNSICQGMTAVANSPLGNPVLVGGIDNNTGVVRTLLTDTGGELIVHQGGTVFAGLSGAWPMEVTDGTNGPVAVKAAGVAPASADPAMVVAISPNTPAVTVTGAVSTTPPSTPTSVATDGQLYDDDGVPYVNPNTPGADIATGQLQQAQLALAANTQPPVVPGMIQGQINSNTAIIGPVVLNGAQRLITNYYGTFAGITLFFEASQDTVNWYSMRGMNAVNAAPINGSLGTTANTSGAEYWDVGGWTYFRVRCSAYTSGELNMTIAPAYAGSAVNASVLVSGLAASGGAVSGVPVLVAGSDGTDARTLATDTSGRANVDVFGNAGATLDAVITAATAPANGLATLAVNETTAPSLTTGQSVAAQCDYGGQLFIKPWRRSLTAKAAGTIASTTAATMLAAQASGVFADLGSLCLTVAGLATTAGDITVNISDGTTTYEFGIYTGATTAGLITPINMQFTPPIPATSAATAWTIALSAADCTVAYVATFVLQKAS